MLPTYNNNHIEIVCMSVTFTVMRKLRVFPPKHTELNPGKGFFLKFFLVWILSILPLYSSVAHFIKTLRRSEYNHIEQDINYGLSFASTFCLSWAFIIRIKPAAHMYTFLSDFEEFGKPKDFEKDNKSFNRYATMTFIWLECLIWVIMLTSNVFKTESCRQENLMYNLTEVCGLFTYTWMPFDIDYTPVRQIYMLIQMFGVHHIYMLAGAISWQVFETMQHVIIRIRHVKYTFIKALAVKDPVERRNRFNFAVRYHNAVLNLEDKLNDAFNILSFSHIVFTAAILGSGIYCFFQRKTLSTFMVCTGWFWGSFMNCFSGARLTDESSELVFAVYDSPWYEYEEDLKKDVLFVIKKCQTSMKLRAGPFGIMDRATFLGILKVTYSYITLFKNA